MGEEKCAHCGAKSSSSVKGGVLLSCGGCGAVKYCSKEHQKSDWKRHKANCKAYRIDKSELWGRYLVTSRALKPGDRILSCLPSILGPPLHSAAPICLRCNARLAGLVPKTKCQTCGYGFCDEACKQESHPECKLLAEVGPGNYEVILPLRFLQLKDREPATYARLLKLESHASDIEDSPRRRQIASRIVDKLLHPSGGVWDKNTVLEVVGIIMTNGFEVSPGSLQGVYELPSMMNHECVGNARLTMDADEHRICVYAASKIEAGAPVLFNYASPLDTTENRLSNLRDFKFFTCSCRRCRDPTELGTMNSAIKMNGCESCKAASPHALPHADGSWMCSECKADIGADALEQVARSRRKLDEARGRLAKVKNERDLRRLYHTVSDIAHPNHGLLSEILQNLIRVVQEGRHGQQGGYFKKLLAEKVGWCERLLKVMDVLEPGLSLSRGIVLYEYHRVLVQQQNIAFEAGEISADLLLDALRRKARPALREAAHAIQLEPEASPVRAQFVTLIQEMEDLDGYIEMVEGI